jgi:hypothetical protein
VYVNAGEEKKKGREREREEGRKGREFIPVGMHANW